MDVGHQAVTLAERFQSLMFRDLSLNGGLEWDGKLAPELRRGRGADAQSRPRDGWSSWLT
jgi:hypothetical protein